MPNSNVVASQSGNYAVPALGALAGALPGITLPVALGAAGLDYVFNNAGYNGSATSNNDANISNNNALSGLREWLNSLLTNDVQFARENRKFNAEEAQKLRDWQERMSNTSYQRAMADMKKAGLNPILAYQQGGASVPGGSAASFSTSAGFSADQLADNIGSIIKYLVGMLLPDANHVVNALGGIVSAFGG